MLNIPLNLTRKVVLFHWLYWHWFSLSVLKVMVDFLMDMDPNPMVSHICAFIMHHTFWGRISTAGTPGGADAYRNGPLIGPVSLSVSNAVCVCVCVCSVPVSVCVCMRCVQERPPNRPCQPFCSHGGAGTTDLQVVSYLAFWSQRQFEQFSRVVQKYWLQSRTGKRPLKRSSLGRETALKEVLLGQSLLSKHKQI